MFICSNQSLHYPDYERRPLHFQVRVLECVSAEACFAIHSLIRNYHIYRVIIKYRKTHRNVQHLLSCIQQAAEDIGRSRNRKSTVYSTTQAPRVSSLPCQAEQSPSDTYRQYTLTLQPLQFQHSGAYKHHGFHCQISTKLVLR